MLGRLRAVAALVLRPLQFVLYLLSGIVPRDRRLWAFGSWGGLRDGDNAGALFGHLVDQPVPGVRTVWITRRPEIRDRVRARGGEAHLVWSPRGAWVAARAGVHVYDSLPRDVNFWLSRRTRRVLLRHGVGLKKIERAIDQPDHRLFKLFHGTTWQRAVYGFSIPWHLPVPDRVIACSPEHAAQAVDYFGVTPDSVEITGFPRHDALATATCPDPTALPTIGRPVPPDRPVVLYLPTFREAVGRQAFDWATLQDAAVAAGVTVAVKLHLVDAGRGVRGMHELEAADHLCLLDPETDPVDLYPCADVLISDFSSVVYDFVLLDRPVVHWVPDHDAFVAKRPLRFTLDEVAAGPVCSTASELTAALVAAVTGDGGSAADRERVRQRFYTYPPGGASDRVRTMLISVAGLEP